MIFKCLEESIHKDKKVEDSGLIGECYISLDRIFSVD